jgi:hypothetical protein
MSLGKFIAYTCVENQKIAACGSSYMGMQTSVGAAAGCDLLTFMGNWPEQQGQVDSSNAPPTPATTPSQWLRPQSRTSAHDGRRWH